MKYTRFLSCTFGNLLNRYNKAVLDFKKKREIANRGHGFVLARNKENKDYTIIQGENTWESILESWRNILAPSAAERKLLFSFLIKFSSGIYVTDIFYFRFHVMFLSQLHYSYQTVREILLYLHCSTSLSWRKSCREPLFQLEAVSEQVDGILQQYFPAFNALEIQAVNMASLYFDFFEQLQVLQLELNKFLNSLRRDPLINPM